MSAPSPSSLSWQMRLILVLVLPTWAVGTWQAMSRPNDMLTKDPNQAVEWLWWKISPRPDPLARYEPLRELLGGVTRADYLLDTAPEGESRPGLRFSAASISRLFVVRYALAPTFVQPIQSLDSVPSRLGDNETYYLLWDRQSNCTLDEVSRVARAAAVERGLTLDVRRFPRGVAILIIEAR